MEDEEENTTLYLTAGERREIQRATNRRCADILDTIALRYAKTDDG